MLVVNSSFFLLSAQRSLMLINRWDMPCPSFVGDAAENRGYGAANTTFAIPFVLLTNLQKNHSFSGLTSGSQLAAS